MRFHKSESAFFVFMTLVLSACVAIVYAHGELMRVEPALVVGPDVVMLAKLLFAATVLLATAIFFGIFFIFPLIRGQVRTEDRLRAMTTTLRERSQTLEHQALTDGLTGMYNRRYFDFALKEYADEFRRIQKPIGLMLLDLDHFKQVNDTHGHDVGDEVLRAVAECLRDLTRYHDVVARLGGEEFAVVAPNMDIEALGRFAERIRKAIASRPIVIDNVRLKITTSVGLAVWTGRETTEELVKRADQQLYHAKRSGRNRVSA